MTCVLNTPVTRPTVLSSSAAVRRWSRAVDGPGRVEEMGLNTIEPYKAEHDRGAQPACASASACAPRAIARPSGPCSLAFSSRSRACVVNKAGMAGQPDDQIC